MHDHNELPAAAIFARLTAQDLRALRSAMRERPLKAGSVLFHEGRAGDCLCVLARGELEVSTAKTAVARLVAGDVVGEMTCIDPAPRSATVVAVTDSVVFELDRIVLDRLRANAPRIATGVIGGVIDSLNRRFRDVHAKMDALDAAAAPRLPQVPAGLRLTSTRGPAPLGAPLDLSGAAGLDGLDAAARQLLVRVAPPMVWGPGAELCGEGDAGVSCFLVVEGTVEVIKALRDGPKVVATLGPGSLLGQLALVDRAPRTATVRAAGRVVALEFDREEFERLLADASPLALHFQHRCAVAGIRQLRLALEWLAAPPRLARSQVRPSAADLTRGMKRRDSASAAAAIRPKRQAKEPVEERPKDYNGYLRAALSEWSLSLDDLDEVTFSQPVGIMSSAEIKARQGR